MQEDGYDATPVAKERNQLTRRCLPSQTPMEDMEASATQQLSNGWKSEAMSMSSRLKRSA